MKRIAITLFALSFVFAGNAAAEDFRDADTLSSLRLPKIEFVSYAGLSGGALYAVGDFLPSSESSGGIQFTPWLAVGAFIGAVPLSDFDHASFGLSAADRENAYAVASGTEVLITPFAGKAVHPLFRVAIGGASIGYMEDIDDAEGMDTTVENRYFFASAAVGAEANLTRHLRLSASVGGRFVNNDEFIGIDKLEMSGIEASLGLRFLWRTSID